MTAQTLRSWLSEAPFSLAMSSGFFGFFAHCGVVTVLEEEGLLPTRLSGSSAGALVTGAWASGVDGQALARTFLSLSRADFWDPKPGFGLLAGGRFRDKLDTMLGAPTFAGCRAPVAISVFDVRARKTVVLERGELAPAIQASCTVPGMFHPVWIEGRPFLDGGILDRPGLLGMPSGERVLFHHLASRSPWRRPGSKSLKLPQRNGLISLVIRDLPRVGPFALPVGAQAFTAARTATRKALEQPVANSAVYVS